MADDGIGESGYTLEALAAYRDRGRTPPVAEIDGDPQCRAVLDSMDRLGALSRELLEEDAQVEVAEPWFQQILSEVARESRAGRDLPLVDGEPLRVVVTEGAVRGLVRDAGDGVEGVLVERVSVDMAPSGRIAVRLTVSVLFAAVPGALGSALPSPGGSSPSVGGLPAVAGAVRERVRASLERYGGWTVGDIDVVVDALRMRGDAR